ncbi:MAG TPA: LuxR C-terminal-related transcriptional regulator [Polyangia bacterium]|jgi:DNA-binding CsgD family transcriptional regulator
MSPAAAQLVLKAVRAGTPPRELARTEPLTARELEVLELLTQGLTYDEAAEVLKISINTIRTYVRSIYNKNKLDVNTKAEAVVIALRQGVVPAPRT